ENPKEQTSAGDGVFCIAAAYMSKRENGFIYINTNLKIDIKTLFFRWARASDRAWKRLCCIWHSRDLKNENGYI
ncbi:hypothetical protein V7166_12960, partial [Bacillus thuringiensis]